MNRFLVLRVACRLSFAVFLFAFAVPVYGQAPALFNGRPAVPEEILIRLRTNTPAALARVRSAVPSAVIETLSPDLGLHLVRAPGNNLTTLVQAFSNQPDVLYAEPNYIVQAISTTPNDPSFSLLWGMTKIESPAAWDISTGGGPSVLGVIDTGIDYGHPDLVGNVWNAPSAFSVTIQGRVVTCPAGSHGFNARDNSCDPLDDHNHGTHVFGTIGATGNNSIGVAGVNWQAKVMGLKFLNASGSGSISNAINTIEFAIQVKSLFAATSTPVNIRVLSNSWGASGFSQGLLDEVNRANANDMLFVAAAGNDSTNNDTSPFYPANLSTLAPNVIAVAATDSGDGLASFSNYGLNSVQLGAPGVAIHSTVRGGYATWDGTSMATPHVAGAALLTLAACPSLTTAALKSALLANVDPVPALSGKSVTGGRLNVDRTLRSCAVVNPNPEAFAATFLGVTGQDLVGPGGALAPNGIVDWHIQVQGLRGTPTRVRITSSGGVWEAPFNGANWLVATQYSGNGIGDFWFEPWSSPTGLHVKVWYSNGTSDEADAGSGPPPPPPPPSSLQAAFLGVTGQDLTGQGGTLGPNGIADWHIQVQGLRSTPTRVRITSSGGVWEAPFNGANWLVATQYSGNGAGDFWFEPWSSPTGLNVKVWYSDGTSEEVDAGSGAPPPPSPTLQATFLGTTGQDFVGPGGTLAPNGVADWHIRLQGLRGAPTRIQITRSGGGVWEAPFNGSNWLVAAQYAGDGTGDLWFEPWSTPSGFHVKVWYSDSTTDEVDAT